MFWIMGKSFIVGWFGSEMPSKTPEVCPVCGEDVPTGALACPECGADERSGWREGGADDEAADGAGLPDDKFDYAAFVAEEFGHSPKPRGIAAIWWITAILLLVALLFIYFRGAW